MEESRKALAASEISSSSLEDDTWSYWNKISKVAFITRILLRNGSILNHCHPLPSWRFIRFLSKIKELSYISKMTQDMVSKLHQGTPGRCRGFTGGTVEYFKI